MDSAQYFAWVEVDREKPLDLYYQTLIEHWNGHTWSVAGPMIRGSLHSVIALSAKNVWAVGTEGYPQIYHTFVEHWNGASWTRMSSLNAPDNRFLNGVRAISTKNIWVVGSSSVNYPFLSQILIEHWDGKTWGIVQSPNGDENLKADLRSVAVISEWAIRQKRGRLHRKYLLSNGILQLLDPGQT